MRILEVATNNNAESERLGALVKFLNGRAQDEAAPRQISISSFINLANGMGISLGVDQLKTLSQNPPLSNLIADVQGDDLNGKVIFKGSEDLDQTTMSVDQARKTVDSMAKRAASKNI